MFRFFDVDDTVLKIELDGANAGASEDGLNITSGSSTVRGLVINRFTRDGIWLETNGGNVIEGNFIGTDVNGALDRGNTIDGVRINNASNNTIGGATAEARNVISGNDVLGVRIFGSLATGNLLQRNLIGTDVTGTLDLGNTLGGVGIRHAPNNTIGGTSAAAGNVISGNDLNGVSIAVSGATGNLVQGNFIGSDVSGILVLGNSGDGVSINGAPNNTIGGNEGTSPGESCTGACNVISGNSSIGVELTGSGATANIVRGNFIGTDVSGIDALPNRLGVAISNGTSNNVVGGITIEAGNLISGNTSNGVAITNGAFGNLVQGNFIGVDRTGTNPLGNGGRGVTINASDNTIGGTADGAGNTIAHNGLGGVKLFPGTGNAILRNTIFSNAGLGIDLVPNGVTPNDAGDGDTGANNLQNFPVLTSAVSGGGTTVEMTLNSTVNTIFRVEFFSNSACDPSGNGEGEIFLGASTDVTTFGDGNANLTITFLTTVPVGQFITAATDPNNTSEFSQCFQVTAVATPVPGLTQWDLIAMTGLMVTIVLWQTRRMTRRARS